MAVDMHSCAMKLKDDVHDDVNSMWNDVSSESYESPDEQKSKSGSSYESNSYSESGGSPDELKLEVMGNCYSGSGSFEEGFAELAAMDVCDEVCYDDLVMSPRTLEDRKKKISQLLDNDPERYSDWWTYEEFPYNKEEDIIDPQIWDAAESLYYEQILASDGFDVDDFTGRYCGFNIIKPCPNFRKTTTFRIVLKLSTLAIEKYNADNGTKYQIVEVEKVNGQLAADFVYYITFKAKQVSDVNEETTFQAVGCSGMPSGELSVSYCRLKPPINLSKVTRDVLTLESNAAYDR